MPTSTSPLAVVPPAVFSRMLETRLSRSDMERRQNSPANDGRTGFVVEYSLRDEYPEFCDLLGID